MDHIRWILAERLSLIGLDLKLAKRALGTPLAARGS